MRLLSPKEIKSSTTSSDSTKIKIELEKYVEEQYKKLQVIEAGIPQETQRLYREFEAIQSDIERKRSSLLEEVGMLEQRKNDALRSLAHQEAELQERELKVSAKDTDLLVRESRADKQESYIREKMEFIADKVDELSEREIVIHNLEIKLASEVEESKISLESLNQKWFDYHRTVSEKESSLVSREKALNDSIEVQKILGESLESTKKELEQDRIEIKDKYVALEQAKKHLQIL